MEWPRNHPCEDGHIDLMLNTAARLWNPLLNSCKWYTL